MAKLQVSTTQKTVIDNADSLLDQAFASGTETGTTPVLDALPRYSTLPSDSKPQTRSVFRATLAAIMVALNIPRALPNTATVTVTIPKLTEAGTNGSLVFTDGLLTARTNPT